MVWKLSAGRLAEMVDAGESFALIDTRPGDGIAAWHAPGATNVPYDPRDELREAQLDAVDVLVDGRPVVIICGKGLTSTPFAFELDERGYDDVPVVTGGVEAGSEACP